MLAPGARAAVYTTSPQLRGTPAAPEPVASRSYFYDDDALAGMARQADFTEVVVVNDKFGIRLTDVVTPSERLRRVSRGA